MSEDLNEIKPQEFPVIEQKEGLKLSKNSKGDYQWEIKLLSLDLEQLYSINKKLEERYGRK